MNILKSLGGLLLFTLLFITTNTGYAQITSYADETVLTEYTSGAQDKIHIFCGAKGDLNASLTASLPAGETGTFQWTKYNSSNVKFEFFRTETGFQTSTISNLENGCYRVEITSNSGVKSIHTAWAFNNYLETTAQIPESDCNSLTLKGSFDTPKLIYNDLTTGQPIELNKNIQVRWLDGDVVVNRVLVSKVYDPPTKDTDYAFEVSDKFECSATATTHYQSIVTKALFTVSTDKGEAPLEVSFNNESENGTPGKFEWFIFRDLDEIKRESAANNGKVKDSILVKLYDDNPVFTFENSGHYKVKLVSKKITDQITCIDTIYLGGYIVADTSFVDCPNVFTPNGDGMNDEFIIKFWSMKEIKISIFNRWGKLLHVWENNNVINFGNTVKSVPQSVWDGKVGGKICTPGVYYYVVEGRGRDDKRRRTSGFFHLFRDK